MSQMLCNSILPTLEINFSETNIEKPGQECFGTPFIWNNHWMAQIKYHSKIKTEFPVECAFSRRVSVYFCLVYIADLVWMQNCCCTIRVKLHEEQSIPFHWPLHCLLKSIFMLTTKKPLTVCITGPLSRESTGNCWFSRQRASKALTYLPLVPHICISELGQHSFR